MKRLLAFVLALSLLLSGCMPYRFLRRYLRRDPGILEQVVADVIRAAHDGAGFTGREITFSELPYASPDEQKLRAVFDAAQSLAAYGDSADELMDALDLAFDAYDDFYTLDTIAMIRSDADQTDAYWREEYNRCERMMAQVEQWYSRMLRACADSALRPALEATGYFAVHELDSYEGGGDYSDELVSLLQRESDLEAEFRALGDEFDLDGEQMRLSEYLAREDLSEEEYSQAYTAYLRNINAEAARIYAALIGVRQEIAAASGYESYEEYCYDYYGRDYGPEEVDAYLDSIRQILGPCREALFARGEYDRRDYPILGEKELLRDLDKVMERLGDPAAEAFDFMQTRELYDVRADQRKASISYTAYLYSYDAPYLFVDAYGDVEDLVCTAHEFGHFLASYVQGYAEVSLDLDETWSQGMEYLTLAELRDILNRPRYEALLRIKLLDTLDTYTDEASYAAFERAAYALPEEERTAERLNALSAECLREFGCDDSEQNVLWWTQIDHLFQMPFYVVSYCVSVDAAMQIYELAMESPKEAWNVYCELLNMPDLSFSEALQEAGLESPFAPGRIEQAKKTIESQLPK